MSEIGVRMKQHNTSRFNECRFNYFKPGKIKKAVFFFPLAMPVWEDATVGTALHTLQKTIRAVWLRAKGQLGQHCTY